MQIVFDAYNSCFSFTPNMFARVVIWDFILFFILFFQTILNVYLMQIVFNVYNSCFSFTPNMFARVVIWDFIFIFLFVLFFQTILM